MEEELKNMTVLNEAPLPGLLPPRGEGPELDQLADAIVESVQA